MAFCFIWLVEIFFGAPRFFRRLFLHVENASFSKLISLTMHASSSAHLLHRNPCTGRLFAPGCAVLERLSIHEKACEALMREQIIPWSLSSCVLER
jgi:hypothetical protein